MEKGICAEWKAPLTNPTSLGYHSSCADIVYEREGKEADEKYPFVVVNWRGRGVTPRESW